MSLVAVTFTAGVQKIWHDDPRIGFLAQAAKLQAERPALETAVDEARVTVDAAAVAAAEKALRGNRTLQFNNRLDAVVAAAFLGLVSVILLMSVIEWVLLLTHRKAPTLRETPPVWLPESALNEGRPLKVFGLFALLAALARELSGEAELDRARLSANVCDCPSPGHDEAQLAAQHAHSTALQSEAERYVEMTERRFNGVKRCC